MIIDNSNGCDPVTARHAAAAHKGEVSVVRSVKSIVLRASRRTVAAIAATLCIATLIVLTSADALWAQRARAEPEEATGWSNRPLVAARRHMVVAAHPVAAHEGREILRRGGNAIDAAIATVLVLNLVEPQSSGLGGGAFLLFHDVASGKLMTYDGRETAPSAAHPDRFMREGRPMPFREAVHSGLSVGVPGLARLLGEVHRQHGRLPWADVVAPAIRIAREGFAVSPRLHALLSYMGPQRFDARARAYFFDGAGAPRPVGARLVNPELATTLELLASAGADAFYGGTIARDIVAAVAGAPNAAGDMTVGDIAAYRAVAREPVCVPYRLRRVCGMGPPSSGALTVAQILKLIAPFGQVQGPAAGMTPSALHLIAEAEKLAYADRDRYVADPAFVTIPQGFLYDSYVAQRRRLIDPRKAMARPTAGVPPGASSDVGADGTRERGGTTHLSVIDAEGNAVAMTATIEGAFGSGIWAAGFLLNNELTDFSFRPTDDAGHAVANRVEGGKRPRSSMAPTIVYDARGEVEAVLGSPGGNRIILYVVKALVGLIDWGGDASAVAALPNLGDRGFGLEVETDRLPAETLTGLVALGHKLRASAMTSGLHILVRRNGMIEGGADPRREGVALGD
ncbi:MAG: gamma-glutamyltransferase [Hyphomicrobiaceae bacterium]